MESKLLSVVIPARNEFPNIVHTVHSILNCWEADGFDPKDIEIIIVDNGSREWEDPIWDKSKPATRGTTTYLMPRGIYWARTLRVLYDPICGNHSARNKGARIARGKYVFFSDGHMSYRPGFFKYSIQACEETGGLVHGVIAWMGAYPPSPTGLGYQYTIKLGEEIKGTWGNYLSTQDKWFYIAAQGHCSVMANRKQFLDFGGYPDIHRTYGGGEFYVDMKWWMFGSTVVCEPRAIGYHLASGRGYTYDHNDYIENVLGVSYALGMDDWRERASINWMRRGRKETIDAIMERNEREYADDRIFIQQRRVHTFNDIIKDMPWNRMNKELYGRESGYMTIFHDTWINLLKEAPDRVKDVYRNSKYQRELEKFIEENLVKYIYKRDPKNPIRSFDDNGECLI